MQDIFSNCSFIFDELNKSGFECFAVGGCVRDVLLSKAPHDFDFTTNASPDEILACFKDYKTYELGKKYGTISVIKDNEVFEITTYRIDGNYKDSRHPERVEFSSNIYDDLSRRDFTVNAMAMDREGKVLDIFGGREDLAKGIIKTVGNPEERFKEDALRIFRALRFSCKLDFNIDTDTSDAIKGLAYLLKNVHPQRIRDELSELLLTHKAADILSEYYKVLFTVIPELGKTYKFPQITAHHRYDVFTHTIKALKYAPLDDEIRFALLFHDIAKPDCHTTDKAGISHFNGHPAKSADIAAEILKRYGYPSDFIDKVYLLIKYHDKRFEKPRLHIKRLLTHLSADDFRKLLVIQRCDISAQSEYLKSEKLRHVDFVESEFNKLLSENLCLNLNDLKIDGNDIKNLGAEGKDIGLILKEILNLVIEEKIENNREELIKTSKRLIGRIDK